MSPKFVKMLWGLAAAALISFAAVYECHDFGWEGIGPVIIGCAIGLPFVFWRTRRRG